jgi:hypothetical protein
MEGGALGCKKTVHYLYGCGIKKYHYEVEMSIRAGVMGAYSKSGQITTKNTKATKKKREGRGRKRKNV